MRGLVIAFTALVACVMVGMVVWNVTVGADLRKECNDRGGYMTQDMQCITGQVIVRNG